MITASNDNIVSCRTSYNCLTSFSLQANPVMIDIPIVEQFLCMGNSGHKCKGKAFALLSSAKSRHLVLFSELCEWDSAVR